MLALIYLCFFSEKAYGHDLALPSNAIMKNLFEGGRRLSGFLIKKLFHVLKVERVFFLRLLPKFQTIHAYLNPPVTSVKFQNNAEDSM